MNFLLKIHCKKQRKRRAGRGAGAKDMGGPGGLGFRHNLETDDQAFELGLRRRVAAHDQRINGRGRSRPAWRRVARMDVEQRWVQSLALSPIATWA